MFQSVVVLIMKEWEDYVYLYEKKEWIKKERDSEVHH